jgi:hypothetical protein
MLAVVVGMEDVDRSSRRYQDLVASERLFHSVKRAKKDIQARAERRIGELAVAKVAFDSARERYMNALYENTAFDQVQEERLKEKEARRVEEDRVLAKAKAKRLLEEYQRAVAEASTPPAQPQLKKLRSDGVSTAGGSGAGAGAGASVSTLASVASTMPPLPPLPPVPPAPTAQPQALPMPPATPASQLSHSLARLTMPPTPVHSSSVAVVKSDH